MIYDCFSFFNELDLLEIRLNVLKDVVDKFVLVEATTTHTGTPKPLYFNENKDRFAAFSDKIIHVTVDDFPEPPANYTAKQASWMRENYQRNAIMRGLEGANQDDLILISDLDEIPSPESIEKCNKKQRIFLFEQLLCNYRINLVSLTTPIWNGTKATDFSTLLDWRTFAKMKPVEYVDPIVNNGPSPTRLRYLKEDIRIKRAGWHFSYLGNTTSIINKIKSIAIEYANENSASAEWITQKIASGDDVCGCGRKFFIVPLDKRFPKYILENQDRYKELIAIPDENYFSRTRTQRWHSLVRGWIRRNGAKLIPRPFKDYLYHNVYCKLVKNPIAI